MTLLLTSAFFFETFI